MTQILFQASPPPTPSCWSNTGPYFLGQLAFWLGKNGLYYEKLLLREITRGDSRKLGEVAIRAPILSVRNMHLSWERAAMKARIQLKCKGIFKVCSLEPQGPWGTRLGGWYSRPLIHSCSIMICCLSGELHHFDYKLTGRGLARVKEPLSLELWGEPSLRGTRIWIWKIVKNSIFWSP